MEIVCCHWTRVCVCVCVKYLRKKIYKKPKMPYCLWELTRSLGRGGRAERSNRHRICSHAIWLRFSFVRIKFLQNALAFAFVRQCVPTVRNKEFCFTKWGKEVFSDSQQQQQPGPRTISTVKLHRLFLSLNHLCLQLPRNQESTLPYQLKWMYFQLKV